MTIEEYDSKKEVREAICKIDGCLDLLETINRNHCVSFSGVGIQAFYASGGPITRVVNDKVLGDRFKNLLLERKQELLNEFDSSKAKNDESINVLMDYNFNAYDSDLQYFEMRIPEGFIAEIKSNKVIMKKK